MTAAELLSTVGVLRLVLKLPVLTLKLLPLITSTLFTYRLPRLADSNVPPRSKLLPLVKIVPNLAVGVPILIVLLLVG